MPSEFALELSDTLCHFFSIPATEEERSEFARAIDFHVKHLGNANRDDNKDDLASLLFLECSEEAERMENGRPPSGKGSLQITDLRRLLSRVQKRLYREAHDRIKSTGTMIPPQPSPPASMRLLSNVS